MHAITSFEGFQNPVPKIPVKEYLSNIVSSAQSLFEEKTKQVLDEIIKFISNHHLPAAILSSDMVSTSNELLINLFASYSKTYNFTLCMLRSTSKTSTKKQILTMLKESLQENGGIVYIEGFEEWNSETLSFIFEYLCDFSSKIGFVVDISSDPRNFSLVVDADILQKLTVNQFFFSKFTSISSEILWNLTRKSNFPVLSSEIFHALDECRSQPAFFKILKGSLLHFFKTNPQAAHNFIFKENLDKFITAKDEWIEYLEQMQKIAEASPLCLFVKIEDLHRSIYQNKGVEESPYFKDLLGKFKTKEFDLFETWMTLLSNFVEKGILSEGEVNNLVAAYEKIPLIQSFNCRDPENPKISKWKSTYILPLLRNKVFRYLKPLSEHILTIKDYNLYILEICPYIDTDVLNKTVSQLSAEDGKTNDMKILFKLLKLKGRHIELNGLFNEFVKDIGSELRKKNLQ